MPRSQATAMSAVAASSRARPFRDRRCTTPGVWESAVGRTSGPKLVHRSGCDKHTANERGGAEAPPLRSPGPDPRSALQMIVHQLGHLEHRHLRLAAEDRTQLVVRVDLTLVLLVLEL